MMEKPNPGDIYYTAAGLECKVIAVAGQKVIFQVFKADGEALVRSEASLGRFRETFRAERPDLDSPTYRVRQHIGQMKRLVSVMTPENWRDMRVLLESQLVELTKEFDSAC